MALRRDGAHGNVKSEAVLLCDWFMIEGVAQVLVVKENGSYHISLRICQWENCCKLSKCIWKGELKMFIRKTTPVTKKKIRPRGVWCLHVFKWLVFLCRSHYLPFLSVFWKRQHCSFASSFKVVFLHSKVTLIHHLHLYDRRELPFLGRPYMLCWEMSWLCICLWVS